MRGIDDLEVVFAVRSDITCRPNSIHKISLIILIKVLRVAHTAPSKSGREHTLWAFSSCLSATVLSKGVNGASPQSTMVAQSSKAFSPDSDSAYTPSTVEIHSVLPVNTLHPERADILRDPSRIPTGPNLAPGLAVTPYRVSVPRIIGTRLSSESYRLAPEPCKLHEYERGTDLSTCKDQKNFERSRMHFSALTVSNGAPRKAMSYF